MNKPHKSSPKGVTDTKTYREGLGLQKRYSEKLQFIGGTDPYWSNNEPESLPSLPRHR